MEATDFGLQLQSSVRSGAHLHEWLECILVLRGHLEVLADGVTQTLQNDDLIVLNKKQVHALRSEEGSLMLVLSIGQGKLHQECGALAQNTVRCGPALRNSAAGMETYFELKRIMVELFSVQIEKPYGYALTMNMNLLRFLHLLYLTFSQQTAKSAPESMRRRPQVADILSYIDQNYKSPLSLQEIADRYYMSPTYFSRYFKKTTGEGYWRYLQTVRAEKSLPHLLHSNTSILEIALEHGFKNARAYADSFLKQYGQSPSNYRKAHRAHVANGESTTILMESVAPKEARLEFLRYIRRYDMSSSRSTTPDIVVDIPAGGPAIGQFPLLEGILLIDTPRAALRADFSSVAEIKSRINAQFVYFQLLDFATARKDVPSLYLDDLLAAVESIMQYGLKLFVRMDFSPTLFTGQNEEITEYVRTRFGAALEVLAQRFPDELARQWKFELVCSNFTKLQGELFYRETHKAIRGFFPHTPIGLFAEMEDERRASGHFESLLGYSLKTGNPPQFITFHSFQNRIKGRYPKDVKFYTGSEDYHINTLRSVRNACQNAGLQPPLYMTAWNTLSGESISEFFTYMRTGLVWDSLLRLCDGVQGVGYRYTISETCPYSGEMNGAPLSLLIFSNTKRPVYFVAEFYGRMVGEALFRSDSICASVSAKGELLVAMWNPLLLNPIHAIDQSLTESLSRKMQARLTGLANREYTVKRFTVDFANNGTFSQINRAGFLNLRDRDALDYYQYTPIGDLFFSTETVQDSTLTLTCTVRYNGIVLYVIT